MSDSNRISRRYFLFAASGATAATALVAARKDDATAPPAKSKLPPAGNGYHVTEHIQNYYRTTKV